MELIRIVILIIAFICFYEWDHLKRNNVRHDEHKYLVMAIFAIIALIFTFLLNDNQPPE